MEATLQERQFKTKLNSDLNGSRAKKGSLIQDAKSVSSFVSTNMVEMGLVLGAAMTVDFIDVLDLTGWGAILVRFIDIPTVCALWIWRLCKQGISPYKKNLTFQMLLVLLTEISPIGIIPAWTALVIYIWIKEHKASKEMFGKTIKRIKTFKK